MTTKRTTKAKTTAAATEPEAQPAQQPEQPQRIKDAIKAHENAIDFIHTAIHRTDCAIQLLTRSGYFTTVQYLQQAKVHLRESERSCRAMIRTIREGNQ